ncbi:MAG: hypothetical protein AB9903_13030 [Vulcanimicrobiota bacterium]
MSRPKKPGGTGRGLPLVGIRLEPELLDWLEKHTKTMKYAHLSPDYKKAAIDNLGEKFSS